MEHKPVFVSRHVARQLIEAGLIVYEDGGGSLYWFHEVHTFADGARHCFDILWKNFLRGNLPLPQGRLLASWRGTSAHASDLLKRCSLWKRVIVGDGKGNVWLHVPERYIDSASKDE